MIELRDELFAAPVYDWQYVPIVVNRHKWRLQWYRLRDAGNFCFSFVSPKQRRYTFCTDGGRVVDAAVALANGDKIASYWEVWGDAPERMDAVIRLTPKHILDRLFVLLDAIR